MTISQEAVSRYDFWLSFIWDEYKINLACLAAAQALLLWVLRGAKRPLILLLLAVVSVVVAWLLCASTLWLVFKVPNSTLATFGAAARWGLQGIPFASIAIAFAATTVTYFRATRPRPAV